MFVCEFREIEIILSEKYILYIFFFLRSSCILLFFFSFFLYERDSFREKKKKILGELTNKQNKQKNRHNLFIKQTKIHNQYLRDEIVRIYLPYRLRNMKTLNVSHVDSSNGRINWAMKSINFFRWSFHFIRKNSTYIYTYIRIPIRMNCEQWNKSVLLDDRFSSLHIHTHTHKQIHHATHTQSYTESNICIIYINMYTKAKMGIINHDSNYMG